MVNRLPTLRVQRKLSRVETCPATLADAAESLLVSVSQHIVREDSEGGWQGFFITVLGCKDMLRQTTFPIVFREFRPSDYERLVEINNAIFPGYLWSVEEARFTDESSEKSNYVQKRFPCLDQDSGTILGFGSIAQVPWNLHPQKFLIDILVDPKLQQKGLGSRIYLRLTEELEKLHATTAWATIKENMPRSLDFATKCGFVEKKRLWESWLVPSEVDSASFQEYADKASSDGIKISTLPEEEAKASESLKGVYELAQDCLEDVPMPTPYTRVSYERWQETELKNPRLLRDGYFVASEGTRFVGYSCVWRVRSEPGTLVQAMTGVRREYRGRGIAMALKLRVLDFARENGYGVIKTWNDSDNAPMLGINTKLGFKREVGWITMEKTLS